MKLLTFSCLIGFSQNQWNQESDNSDIDLQKENATKERQQWHFKEVTFEKNSFFMNTLSYLLLLHWKNLI